MPWYLVQQPQSLERLAIPKIGDWIASQAENLLSTENKAEDLLSHKIEVIRQHLDRNLPYIYRNKLVIEAMRALQKLSMNTKTSSLSCKERYTVCNIIARMTETFLYSKNVTSLSISDNCLWWHKPYPSFSESHKLTDLSNLDIGGFHYVIVIPLLKELHNLRALKMREVNDVYCCEEVLACLVENCKLIEELDISISVVDDCTLNLLSQMPNLKSITFSKSCLKHYAIEILLLSCVNLEFIDYLEMNDTEWDDDKEYIKVVNALQSISLSKTNAGKQFKLKSLGSEYCSLEQLHLIVQTCPLLQEIRLSRAMLPDSPKLLNDFQDLRKLELNYMSYGNLVKEALLNKGCNLVDLKLTFMKDMNVNALMCIFQMCPNLESLSIDIIGFIVDWLDKIDVNKIAPLSKLKTLDLSRRQPSDETLFFVLSNCPNVEYISIKDDVLLTDSIVLKVLDQNSWSCLKKLKMSDSMLSRFVVDLILQNCIGLEIEIR